MSNDLAVYYGTGEIEKLLMYDKVIIQPWTLNSEELKGLGRTVGVFCYLSIGESTAPRKSTLGFNKNWNSYYADPRDPLWCAEVIKEARDIAAAGFHGLFLDTVDTILVYPEVAESMVNLILSLKSILPVIQNRGFYIQSATRPYGLLAENFCTNDNFQFSLDPEILKLCLKAKDLGIQVFTLDYAKSWWTRYKVVSAVKKYGFKGYIAGSLALDKI